MSESIYRHRVDSQRSPALTVILPHFSSASYLGLAVGSVLGQDFRDLDLIVVDDCSPNSDWVQALQPFATDRRLSVLRTSVNVSTLRIKNAVLRSVRTPYVGFQDADDISLPGRFRRQIQVLASGRADIVGCAIEYIDEDGKSTGHRRMVRNGNMRIKLDRSNLAPHVAHHPATVVRREVLERLCGFDGTARLGADADFHLRAAYLYRLRNIRRVLYQYRIWPKSLTQDPTTGFGSAIRTAYTEGMCTREQARRSARTREELMPLLVAPPNDVKFDLYPVRIGAV